MKPIRTYHVAPSLPEPLAPLRTLAYNIYWAWHVEAISLFRRIDRDLWESVGHNPVRLLGDVRQQRLAELATDEGFLAHLRRVKEQFEEYCSRETYVQRACRDQQLQVAYFSAEFGLTECIPIYSGGLGMLAGDHLKSASDLGLKLAGVGLLYQKGYFRQFLNADGWQQELYPENDFSNMPLTLCRDDEGQPVQIEVAYPKGPVHAYVWRVDVGRITLYLLDTNNPLNSRQEDRDITDQLYGGDNEMRVRQEIMLGIGGLRALRALGIEPNVCHMNEGHAAFLGLERIRVLMADEGLTFEQARESSAAGNIFTTHTPVPAGHDRFTPEVMERYFASYYPQLGLDSKRFLALGREKPGQEGELFCMTVLALNLVAHSNGVSALHGEVSRKMWVTAYPGVPTEEVPIGHVTNGVHARSWVSGDMAELYDRYLGPRWADDPMDRAVWERAGQIPDEELWRTHERRRERLVAFARQRLRKQLERVGATQREIRTASEVLDPKALTIGFARRFATYKRATLLLHDIERLSRILNDVDRPVQILFSGKAHPMDNAGKELIRSIVRTGRRDDFRRRIVFLEDYDQASARYLVQGVDVWLNTPLRPLEASGTSGMKVVFNGGLNCSIPDGWWPEGFNGTNGWCIGRGESYEDLDYQNEVESSALYDLLEREIVPLYYERAADGVPRGWVERIKSSLRTLAPVFNTNRMVLEYAQRYYLPAGLHHDKLNADDRVAALDLAAWKQRLQAGWPGVAVVTVDGDSRENVSVGEELQVQATLKLGSLTTDDVEVQLWYGGVNAHGEITKAATRKMRPGDVRTDGQMVYTGSIPCHESGRRGFAVRVIPAHPNLTSPLSLGLVHWAG